MSPPTPSLGPMVESKDEFRMMIDAIPTMAWSSSADGAVKFLNHQWHHSAHLHSKVYGFWTEPLERIGGQQIRCALATAESMHTGKTLTPYDGQQSSMFRILPSREGIKAPVEGPIQVEAVARVFHHDPGRAALRTRPPRPSSGQIRCSLNRTDDTLTTIWGFRSTIKTASGNIAGLPAAQILFEVQVV